MMRPSRILLADILEAARLLEDYTSDITLEEFRDSVEKQDSVIHRIIIIGEAVKGLPAALRDRYAETPWRDIAGARDVLIHEYFRVDVDLTWDMVKKDVPELATTVRRILQDLEDGE